MYSSAAEFVLVLPEQRGEPGLERTRLLSSAPVGVDTWTSERHDPGHPRSRTAHRVMPVAQELRERSGGVFDLPEGTIYPALHRLERSPAALERKWATIAGRRRRVYQLTAKGRRSIGAARREWKRFADAVEAVDRVSDHGSFTEQLERELTARRVRPAVRRRILLRVRRSHRQRRLNGRGTLGIRVRWPASSRRSWPDEARRTTATPFSPCRPPPWRWSSDSWRSDTPAATGGRATAGRWRCELPAILAMLCAPQVALVTGLLAATRSAAPPARGRPCRMRRWP